MCMYVCVFSNVFSFYNFYYKICLSWLNLILGTLFYFIIVVDIVNVIAFLIAFLERPQLSY
jgi:hypothetical protein